MQQISLLGFRPLAAMPNTFIGNIESQTLNVPFVAMLTVMPLRLQQDKFVFSLAINGTQHEMSKVGTLEDLKHIIDTSVLLQDITTWKEGKAIKEAPIVDSNSNPA